ncbi:hypothetical protein KSP39_PZI002109 [Platanthera zijinensis]|uniref:Myb/SANT-like domain-containing protein n=1 Tax=Platanthera zijinensis TaxID=2320716 RepID=A0AAP0C0L8_9ASPA
MDKSKSKTGGRTDRSYMHWTNEMDIALSNLLLEQHSLGHKTPNGWKSVTFTAAVTALKDICGVDSSKEKVMSRMKTWNKYYQEVSAMLDTSGFGWDWEKNMVKVDSDEVWANYVKAHPTVKHYKDKVIVNWSDLSVLCGNDKATGSNAATAVEMTNEIDAESIAEDTNSTRDHSRLDVECSYRARKKRVVGGIDGMALAIEKLADSVHKELNTDTTSSSATRSSSNTAGIYIALVLHLLKAMNMLRYDMRDIAGIYEALRRLSNLEELELVRAMNLLSFDGTKYDIFMTLPDNLKSVWLLMEFEN